MATGTPGQVIVIVKGFWGPSIRPVIATETRDFLRAQVVEKGTQVVEKGTQVVEKGTQNGFAGSTGRDRRHCQVVAIYCRQGARSSPSRPTGKRLPPPVVVSFRKGPASEIPGPCARGLVVFRFPLRPLRRERES